ncbi:hypothetical protein JCM11641_002967 [Rhodosporidiobolus odoratus]
MATVRFDVPSLNRLASLPIDVLNSLFALALTAAVHSNDRLATKGVVTRFHSKQPPPLEIGQYLARLTKFTPFPRDALLLAIVYLNRISHLPYTAEPNIRPAPLLSVPPAGRSRSSPRSPFLPLTPSSPASSPALAPPTSPLRAAVPVPPSPTISSVERPRTTPILNSYTLHRLVLATLLVATKFTCDGTLSQTRAAKVGGVTVSELCKLEGEVIRLLGWQLYWGLDEMEDVARELERRGVEENLIEAVEHPPTRREKGASSACSLASSSPERTPTSCAHTMSPPLPSLLETPPRPILSTSSSSEYTSSQPSSSASSPRLFSPTTSLRSRPRTLTSTTADDHEEEGEGEGPGCEDVTPPSSPSVASADGRPEGDREGTVEAGRKCVSLKASDETLEERSATLASEAPSQGPPVGTLILARHGQSETNAANIFTGLLDPPLTARGIREATGLGHSLKALDLPPITHAYDSPLQRAASSLSHLLSSLAQPDPAPTVTIAPELNERDYGDLNGRDKGEVAREFGKEQTEEWRRGWRGIPPGGESLEMTSRRVWEYYEEEILPKLKDGSCVLLVSHGNTLRGLCKELDGMGEDQVMKLTLGTGALREYRVDQEGKVVERRLFVVNGLEGGEQS